MGSGELVSKEQLERWQERGLIRAIPLHGRIRHVRPEELARLPTAPFTGFAPLHEANDVVRVKRARTIE